MEFSRQYPQASRIFATDILGGHVNVLQKIHAEVRPIVAEKCRLIDRWIAEGKLASRDPLNLFFMIWGVTEYYANFATEINVFFDGKNMTDRDYEKAVQTVIELIVNGWRPAAHKAQTRGALK